MKGDTVAREPSISQEQVNSAADAIRATGQQPTARAVREALGSGSMATVLKLLQTWKAGQVKVQPADVTLPPALSRYLVDFVAQEVAKGRAEVEAELVASQQATADLIAENERQGSHIEALTTACDELQAERAEIAGRLAQMESDLATARDDARAAEQAAEGVRTELAKAQLRLEAMPRLENELEKILASLAVEKEARNRAEQEAAVVRARLEEVKERAAQEKTQSDRREADLMEARTKAEKATQDLMDARLKGVEAHARADALARELEAVSKRMEAMGDQGENPDEAAAPGRKRKS